MRSLSILLLFSSSVLCAAQIAAAVPAGDSATCPAGSAPALAGAEITCQPADGRLAARMRTVALTREPAPTPPPEMELPAAYPPAPDPVEPLARSDFQVFAEEEAGQPLPVFGRKLFEQVPTTFAPLSNTPVPASYTLGPGDELLIRIWGKIDLDTRVTIDRNGQIELPRIGTLSVAGLRYEQAESYLRTAVGSLYKGFELNVTMGRLRTIQVYVLGSARQPGLYTVGALSTLVDALFASGGPSATGSMRRIELRRANREVATLDLYRLLRQGDKSQDAPLLPGDVIYLPPAGAQVALAGSVNEPGIYELKPGETVAAALEDAGGLSSLAGVERALLERVEQHRLRRVDEFALDAAGKQRTLQDGDLLRVFPLSPRFENAVTLRGNVAQPGKYRWHEGMRVSDLIPSRLFLLTRGYWNQQNYLVPPAAEHPFGPVAGTAPLAEGAAAPTGAPGTAEAAEERAGAMPAELDRTRPAPGKKARERAATAIDAARNSNEINWAYAAVERLDPNDLSTQLIAFNLGRAIETPGSSDNLALQPGDTVTIFSQKDLPLPVASRAVFVSVEGEVNAPGMYRIQPGETLQQAVERAGGLTARSYLYASQLTRVSTRLAQERELRQSAAQMERELMTRYAAAPSALGATTTAKDQEAQLTAQRAMIAEITALRPTGRVVLAMRPDAHSVKDIPDFQLEDGDRFYIPPMQDTVQVAGAVYNENAFRYERKKRLDAYLHDAGGPTRQADTRRIYLIRADGTVVSRQSHSAAWRTGFEKLTLLPGDAIIVPTKLKTPGSWMQQLPFVTQILSQTALTGAVIGSSY